VTLSETNGKRPRASAEYSTNALGNTNADATATSSTAVVKFFEAFIHTSLELIGSRQPNNLLQLA
jgi:hypothetical protein